MIKLRAGKIVPGVRVLATKDHGLGSKPHGERRDPTPKMVL